MKHPDKMVPMAEKLNKMLEKSKEDIELKAIANKRPISSIISLIFSIKYIIKMIILMISLESPTVFNKFSI